MSQQNFESMDPAFAGQPMGAGMPGAGMHGAGMPGPGMPGPGMQGPGMPGPQAAPVQKQRFNVYTMMLILSFFALLTASLLLWFELSDYLQGQTWPPWDTSSVSSLERPASTWRIV